MTNMSWCRVILGVSLLSASAIASQAQVFHTLFEFDGDNGLSAGPIVQGTDGNLYGVTYEGGQNSQCAGDGCGTIFKITPEGRFKTIHTFCVDQGCPDGASPYGALVLGRDQNFYGTAYGGGGGGNGSVFKISPLGKFTTLYKFNGNDGSGPMGALILAPDGNFYGATTVGGAYGAGIVFRITASGQLTTLHTFCAQAGCPDGAFPTGLVQASDGNLYGTTIGGGMGNPNDCQNQDYACGTVFRISALGAFTTIFNFCSSEQCAEGAGPMGKLLQASNGLLYGTTLDGGDFLCGLPYGCGTVFQLRLNGREGTVHIFRGPEGATPYAGVIQTTDGHLWGTSSDTLFEISPDRTLVNHHELGGPARGVMQATNGILYGTTASGGAHGAGSVFSYANNYGPFVAFVVPAGKVGETGGILGQGFTGTTSVLLNGTPASFTVVSDTYIRATVPAGATTGYITVTTPSGTLTSNVPFRVLR